MSAFPKADIQNVRIGIALDGCLWPKADIETESKSRILNVRFGEKSIRISPNGSCTAIEAIKPNPPKDGNGKPWVLASYEKLGMRPRGTP